MDTPLHLINYLLPARIYAGILIDPLPEYYLNRYFI